VTRRRLLITTQAVDKDDPVLGFFHGWLAELSSQCEHVTVIALRAGRFDLPGNVKVISLGKEQGAGRFRMIMRLLRLVVGERRSYEAVLVHMNPEYIVLCGLLWKAMGKRVGLWYAHRSVTAYLRIALRLSDAVFTPSAKSFRIDSPKVHVTGHGIEVPAAVAPKAWQGGAIRVLILGRIAPIKDIERSLEAFSILASAGKKVEVSIVGEADMRNKAYEAALRESARGVAFPVHFSGTVRHADLAGVFQEHDLLLNTSNTGSADKTVLEAAAFGLPVVTSNEGFSGVLSSPWFSADPSPKALAQAIEKALSKGVGDLAAEVRSVHALPGTIRTVLATLFPR
jgi:glycosyltransferase involved in cell wall biosynthesis